MNWRRANFVHLRNRPQRRKVIWLNRCIVRESSRSGWEIMTMQSAILKMRSTKIRSAPTHGFRSDSAGTGQQALREIFKRDSALGRGDTATRRLWAIQAE